MANNFYEFVNPKLVLGLGHHQGFSFQNSFLQTINSISQATDLMSRMFTSGPGDQVSILGWVIRKTQKVVLDSTLISTQYYKVKIKGEMKQSWERSSSSLHLGVVAIEKGTFGSPSTMVANFTYIIKICVSICIYIYLYSFLMRLYTYIYI